MLADQLVCEQRAVADRQACEQQRMAERREAEEKQAAADAETVIALLRGMNTDRAAFVSVPPTLLPMSDAAANWRADVQRQIDQGLVTLVSDALYVSSNGNSTFRAELAGLRISGTIFRRGGRWKYLCNIPTRTDGSWSSYAEWYDARKAMIATFRRLLTEYLATNQAYKTHGPAPLVSWCDNLELERTTCVAMS